MSSKTKRTLLFLIWLFIILSGPVSVVQNQPSLLKFFQRTAGLLGFSFLFIQIVLGALMKKWIEFFGSKIFKFHVTQGILGYGFVLIHLLFQYLVLFSFSGFANFWKFTNPWINLGRVAFIFLTVGVLAAYFRAKPVFQRNWRLFHIFNYFVFFLVAIHAGKIGTDVKTFPFSFVYRLTITLVALTILYRFVWLKLKSRDNIKI